MARTVADRIRRAREEEGMTQADLAKALGLKSRSSVTRIEKSGDDITLKDVQRVADALGRSPLELMGWTQSKIVVTHKDKNSDSSAKIEIKVPLNKKSAIERLTNYAKALSNKDIQSIEDYAKYLAEKNKKED